jgi:hypothetical protein
VLKDGDAGFYFYVFEPGCLGPGTLAKVGKQQQGGRDGDQDQAEGEAAKEAQMRGEEACVSKAWVVQRPASISEEMGRKKKVVAPPSDKGTILQSFPRVRKVYDESEKAPETLHADKCSIWKEERDGRAVWVSAAGHVFDCDSTGEPGEFIRREERMSK